jgi:hypothetical protein
VWLCSPAGWLGPPTEQVGPPHPTVAPASPTVVLQPGPRGPGSYWVAMHLAVCMAYRSSGWKQHCCYLCHHRRFCKTNGPSSCMHAVGLFVFVVEACLSSASESAATCNPAQTRSSDTRCLLLLAGVKAMCYKSSSQHPRHLGRYVISLLGGLLTASACIHVVSSVLVLIVV